MKIKDTFKVISSEKKSGVSKSGNAWEKTEYLLKNEAENFDGSIITTHLTADTSQSVGELKVGATYNLTLYIASREFIKDGKTSYFVSFRVTNAECLDEGEAEQPSEAQDAGAIDDSIPF